MNRRGGALLATIIISMLLLSVSVWYFQWSWTQSQETTHAQASQRALEYAESGIQAAQEQLMMPYAGQGANLTPGSGDTTRGRYDFALYQDTHTPTQVTVSVTGYCYFPRGSEEDPLTHKRAQKAVIRANYYVDQVDKVMIAVPGKLNVNPGAVVAGAVYASDLVFVKGTGVNPARIGAAVYSRSISRDDGTTDLYPSYAVFMSSPTSLGFPLRYPELSGNLRNFYQAYATSHTSQLQDGSSLDGPVDAPETSELPVYFCNGDLHISKSSTFTPKGLFIVYVTGVLHIHNSLPTGDGWAVFMAEKGIRIEYDTPNDLVLHGTFITNGTIASIPQHRAGSLTVNGSLIAGQGIDLAVGWDGPRTYYHRKAFPSLLLPHLIERLGSEVEQGKFK